MQKTKSTKNTKGYIAKTLLPDEEIIYQTKLHWITITGWSVFWFIVGLLVWFLQGLFINALPLFFASFVSLLILTVRYFVSEFAVTNMRVIIKIGFIQQVSSEIYLSKVESIQVEQGLMGRILNYGIIVVNGIGGTKNVYKNVRKPLEFRKIIQDRLSKK